MAQRLPFSYVEIISQLDEISTTKESVKLVDGESRGKPEKKTSTEKTKDNSVYFVMGEALQYNPKEQSIKRSYTFQSNEYKLDQQSDISFWTDKVNVCRVVIVRDRSDGTHWFLHDAPEFSRSKCGAFEAARPSLASHSKLEVLAILPGPESVDAREIARYLGVDESCVKVISTAVRQDGFYKVKYTLPTKELPNGELRIFNDKYNEIYDDAFVHQKPDYISKENDDDFAIRLCELLKATFVCEDLYSGDFDEAKLIQEKAQKKLDPEKLEQVKKDLDQIKKILIRYNPKLSAEFINPNFDVFGLTVAQGLNRFLLLSNIILGLYKKPEEEVEKFRLSKYCLKRYDYIRPLAKAIMSQQAAKTVVTTEPPRLS